MSLMIRKLQHIIAQRDERGRALKMYGFTALSTISAYALTTSSTMSPLLELILGGSVIAVLYLTLLPITGAINSPDLKEIRKIIGPIKPIQQLAEPFLAVMERIAK